MATNNKNRKNGIQKEIQNKMSFEAYKGIHTGKCSVERSKAGNLYLFFAEEEHIVAISDKLQKKGVAYLKKVDKANLKVADLVFEETNDDGDTVDVIVPCLYEEVRDVVIDDF